MAVAPINKVREVLDYAVTQIPPSKLLMGIPNYGYDWTLPYVKGESKARSLTNAQAEALAREYGVPIQYDTVAQSPYFTYTDSDGQQHEVWFENQSSYDAKMKLVKEYDLAGFSVWNIMNYSPALWNAMNHNFQAVKVI